MVDKTCNQTLKAEDHHELEVSLGYNMNLSQTNKQTNKSYNSGQCMRCLVGKGIFELHPWNSNEGIKRATNSPLTSICML